MPANLQFQGDFAPFARQVRTGRIRARRNYLTNNSDCHLWTAQLPSFILIQQFVIDFQPMRENKMRLGTILLIVIILALIGVIPAWPYSTSWGYGPSGGLGVLVLVLIVLVLMGRI